MTDKQKVLVAMSGGVDSSVAAKLLVEQGFSCVGCTMKLHNPEDLLGENTESCGSGSDIEDARSVASTLGFPFCVKDYTQEFRRNVIDEFCDCYLSGKTPNPCIECNRSMKFGKLFEVADEHDCHYVATGHYVRVAERDGVFYLRKAADLSKDQSYVLYFLNQEQLSRVLFPLGENTKDETRKLASEQGLRNANKAESMDICFVPDGDYSAVVKHYAGSTGEEGNFVNSNGDVLGTHKGIACYTIGQRKGLGLYGPEPVYVNHIDPETNTICVGPKQELLSKSCVVRQFNWAAGNAPEAALSEQGLRCAAKIRYRQTEQACTVYATHDNADCVRIVFDEEQSAITPGQSAVLYSGELVLGGGRIV